MMEKFESLSEKLARITIERDRLREENRRLRELLGHASGIGESLGAEDRRLFLKEFDSAAENLRFASIATCRTELTIPEKISLFRSLFRGREDVYAVRFETANGKVGIPRLAGEIGMPCVLSQNRNGRDVTRKRVSCYL